MIVFGLKVVLCVYDVLCVFVELLQYVSLELFQSVRVRAQSRSSCRYSAGSSCSYPFA